MKIRIVFARFIAVALLSVAFGAAATTITVVNNTDGAAPGPVGSLRRAISDAASGSTITFATNLGTITLTNGELLVDKNLTINGPGSKVLTVRRSSAAGTTDFRIFEIAGVGTSVTISGMTISNGSAAGFGYGGGLYNTATAIISDVTVSGNKAVLGYGEGGGIENDGTMSIDNSTVSANMAADDNYAGGIYNQGALTITNTIISGNTIGGTGWGGGIYASGGTLTISNSEISGNTGGSGGGIFNQGNALTINASTLSGNTTTNGAAFSYGGGGIYSDRGAITIANSTIAGNTAASGGYGGGGIENDGPAWQAASTIIALNVAAIAPDVLGAVTSQGFNLIGNNSGASFSGQATDQIGTPGLPVDPKLGALLDNGGPTRTRALAADSPAVDKGNSGGASTDQRGFTRTIDAPIANATGGDGTDIGAYEVPADQLAGCSTVVTNNNDSGGNSLRAIIAAACPGSTITFAANVRGAINLTSAELLIDKNLTISGPGANLLSVQRASTSVLPAFRIFNLTTGITAALSGLTVANGNSSGDGGGIFTSALLTLRNTTVSGNVANLGAGIWNTGTLDLRDSFIVANVASSPGGGLGNRSDGTVRAVTSTIAYNTAAYGGGVANYGNLIIVDSTIAANEAITNGGGIYNAAGPAAANIYNSTIAYNDADYERLGSTGGGVYLVAGGTFNVRNTLIASNTVGNTPVYDDCTGALSSYARNLFGLTDGCQITTGSGQWNLLAPANYLGALQDNGGPTQTVALLAGSNAVDGATQGPCVDDHSATIATDQRGYARSIGTCDVGAFEFGADKIFANGFD